MVVTGFCRTLTSASYSLLHLSFLLDTAPATNILLSIYGSLMASTRKNSYQKEKTTKNHIGQPITKGSSDLSASSSFIAHQQMTKAIANFKFSTLSSELWWKCRQPGKFTAEQHRCNKEFHKLRNRRDFDVWERMYFIMFSSRWIFSRNAVFLIYFSSWFCSFSKRRCLI